MTAISKLQFSPFHANFCRGWAKPLICLRAECGPPEKFCRKDNFPKSLPVGKLR